jgi:hypothetical protein
MAEASARLLSGKYQGIFVMKGHEDGIISYGTSAEEAGKVILDLYRKLAVRQ